MASISRPTSTTQPWYSGQFATLGASYLGFAQWALLRDPPEDCVASIMPSSPHDFFEYQWGTGSVKLERVNWADLVAHQEEPTWFPPQLRVFMNEETLRPVVEAIPLLENVLNSSAAKEVSLKDSLTRPDPDDEYWMPMRHHDSLKRVHHSVYLVTGCPESIPDMLRILDDSFGLRATWGGAKPSSARIFVNGAGEWRTMPDFPPRGKPLTLYLHADNSLSTAETGAVEGSASFAYEPSNPTPTLGGPLLTALEGRRTISKLWASPSFTSRTRARPPHVDLFVRLSEVDSQGVSYNVTDVYRALDPKRGGDSIALYLNHCAHRFREGTMVRLVVAGGSFPLYARNLGTGELRTVGREMRSVRHTLSLSSGASRLVLPVTSKSYKRFPIEG
ncbi:galactose-binding domain-like protein [Xylariaceae sp. FL0016]|nr:galactose-binding domain-like protein [Xylariaceae sp. FL0016]